jgi:hypothetical protein
MPKKKSPVKIPYHGDKVTIYGIFHLPTSKLIKVDLSEEEIFFEYDMSMYNPEEYCIVKLQVSL